jgi:hypothetical protein
VSREEALEFIQGLPTSRSARRKRYKELGLSREARQAAEQHVRQLRLIEQAQLQEQAKDVFGT